MAGQNTLAPTPFNPAIQKWIASNAEYINRLAGALNIPAAAIAGAPAEEASHMVGVKTISVPPDVPGAPTQMTMTTRNFKDVAQDLLASATPSFFIGRDYASRLPDIQPGAKPSAGLSTNLIDHLKTSAIARYIQRRTTWGGEISMLVRRRSPGFC